MDSERIKQAVIRALVSAVLAAIGVLIPWLTLPEAQDALGQWAIYAPILIGVLQGIAKAIGGATAAPVTRRGVSDADRRGVERPNILAV